jgi:hypothetical protein
LEYGADVTNAKSLRDIFTTTAAVVPTAATKATAKKMIVLSS